MPLQQIDENTVEIFDDKNKKFSKAISVYEKIGWKIMFYSSLPTKTKLYYQVIMAKDESKFFKVFGHSFKELNNETNH